MKTEKYSVNRAANIIENEGIGYAVMHYCSGSDFKDKKLGKLWDKAEKTLFELQDYIEKYKSDEDDE